MRIVIGRIILGVFLTLLAIIGIVLVIVLAMPAGLRFTYDRGEITLFVRLGPVKLQIFPKKEPKEGQKPKKKKPKKEKKKKEPEEESGEAKEKKKFSINQDQIFHSLEKLPPILGRALRGVGRGIRLDPLKVHILIAGTDPAATARLYGKLYAALTVGVPEAERLLRIKNQDIRLFVDFLEEKPDLIADVGIALRPWRAVAVALRAGVGGLGWFLGFRKLATPVEKADQKTKKKAKTPDDTNEQKAA